MNKVKSWSRVNVHILGVWIISIVMGAWLSPELLGQTGSSSLVGVVTDQTGAVVPGATITITNEATGVNRSVVTNSEGSYEVSFLAPATYTVRAKHDGFATMEVTGIQVAMRTVVRSDVALKLSTTAQTMTVKSTAPILITESGEVGTTLTTQEMTQLPVLARDFADLQALTPGVVPGYVSGGQYGVYLGPGFTVGGGDFNSTDFTIDGADNNNQNQFHQSMSPSLDAISEVNVRTGGMSAEYGRSGSAVDVSLKSGTNKFHGALFEYHQDNALDARNAWAVGKSAATRRNQFGVTVGGPILKNKLFFFSSYQALRSSNDVTINEQVPTADQRNGIFTFDVKDPSTGQNFPNRTIPADRITPFGAELMSLFPLANDGVFFRGHGATTNSWDQFDEKVDYVFSSLDALSFTFARRQNTFAGTTGAALAPNIVLFNLRRGGVNWTHTVSPRLVNSLSVSSHRDSDQFSNKATLAGVDFWGEIGSNLPGHGPGYPFTIIGGPDYSGTVGEYPGPIGADVTTYQLSDSIHLTEGRHNIATGIDVHYTQSNNLNTANIKKGFMIFQGGFTGAGLGDMLLGRPFYFLFNPGAPGSGKYYWRDHQIVGFFQDDWKVTPRLTLNLGGRFEYSPWAVEKFDRVIGSVPDLGKLVVTGSLDNNPYVNPQALALYPPGSFVTSESVGLPRRTLKFPDSTKWAPRVGFAYQPRFVKETTIRGSYGIGYVPDASYQYSSDGIGAPFTAGVTMVNPDPFDISDPLAAFGGPAPPSTFPAVNVDPHLKREYVQSWNLNVQKALPGQMVLDVGYQGSRMLHGPQQFNINQSMTFPNTNNFRPNTPFTTITSTISSGESRYNSLQVKLKKPLTNGLLFTVNYTWSKTMDNLATVLFGNSGADYWHRDHDWGPTDYGRAHVLTSDFIYILPVGSGRRWMSNVNPVVNGFLGGWQLTGIATLMSGPGLTILSSSAQASLNVVRPVRADCTAGHGELSNRSADEWFNTADFSMPPNTRTGNCGRNILTGPPTVNFDLGLYKNFHLSEAASLQFRMEAFDAFNHQQWNTPGLDVNAPATFGKILGTSGERQLQLALRLEF